MNRIGNFSNGAPGQQGDANSANDMSLHSGRQRYARPDARDAGVSGKSQPGKLTGAQDEVAARSAAFARSLRGAAGESPQGASADEQRDSERVLAIAEGLAMPPQIPALVMPQGQPEKLVSATLDPMVVRVIEQIERAIRTELFTNVAGGTSTIELDLGAAVEGLRSLSVTMTPSGLDVTLSRTSGEVTPELLQAAQSLATQLQMRFSNRVVRVLQVADDTRAADGEHPNGMATISQILGGARSRK